MAIRVGMKLQIDEDSQNEFKMHTRMSLYEIPSRCSTVDRGRIVRTMQPASKTISAFLNTHGGQIWFGIDDEGMIQGIRLTKNMIDHFYLALNECLNQFNPPVSPEYVKVTIRELAEDADDNNNRYCYGSDDEDDFSDGDITEFKPLSDWYIQEHFIGDGKCECQQMTLSQSKLYLIVIKVLPSNDGTIYQNEEGLAYRRRNGSNRMITIDEVRQNIDTDIIHFVNPWSIMFEFLKRLF